jgi:hypothetical protein
MAPGMASGIYFGRFEDERLLGPYSDAVHELDDQQMLQLCLLAAR